MLSRRASDAFEDITTDENERQRAQYEHACELLHEQSESLIEADSGTDDLVSEAHHAPHNPHWRGLSSAALRLIRAHEQVEEAAQD